MERFKKFSMVIGLLLSRGYTIDFGQITKAEKDFYLSHIENKPPEDFDNEIFCCREKFEAFAICCERHHFNGILIVGYDSESLEFWNAFTEILERLKSSLSQLLSTYELSRERQ
jgi:hypothetical protein